MAADDPFANDRRAELEARITALLLGEYEGSVAADLREAIDADPELRALHDRLQKTIGLLGAVSKPAEEMPLDEDKRAAVLEQLKAPIPETERGLQAAETLEADNAKDLQNTSRTVSAPQRPEGRAPVNAFAPWFRKWARPIGLAACLGGLLVVGSVSLVDRTTKEPTAMAAIADLEEIDEEKHHWAWRDSDNASEPTEPLTTTIVMRAQDPNLDDKASTYALAGQVPPEISVDDATGAVRLTPPEDLAETTIELFQKERTSSELFLPSAPSSPDADRAPKSGMIAGLGFVRGAQASGSAALAQSSHPKTVWFGSAASGEESKAIPGLKAERDFILAGDDSGVSTVDSLSSEISRVANFSKSAPAPIALEGMDLALSTPPTDMSGPEVTVFFDVDFNQNASFQSKNSGVEAEQLRADLESGGEARTDDTITLFARGPQGEDFGANAANANNNKNLAWGAYRSSGGAEAGGKLVNDLQELTEQSAPQEKAPIVVNRINGSDGAVTVEFEAGEAIAGEAAGKEVELRFGDGLAMGGNDSYGFAGGARFAGEAGAAKNDRFRPDVKAPGTFPSSTRTREWSEQDSKDYDTGGHATFVEGIISSSGSNKPGEVVDNDGVTSIPGSTNGIGFRGMAPDAYVSALDFDDPGPFVPQAQSVTGNAPGTSLKELNGQTPTLGDIPMMGRLFRSESGTSGGMGGGGGGGIQIPRFSVADQRVAQASSPAGSPGVPARRFGRAGETPPAPPAAPQSSLAKKEDKPDDVAALIQDGKALYEMRLLDESKKKLSEAVAKDPNAKAAHYYLSLVQEEEYGEEARKRDAMQKEQLAAVNNAWEKGQSLKRKSLPEPQAYFRTNTIATKTGAIHPVKKAAPEPEPKPAKPLPRAKPNPIVATKQNAFSTFSLNVSDVSFKLAAASLEQGKLPDPGSVRSEEFVNAFDYRDPAPSGNEKLAFAWERARDPFAHNSDLIRFSVQTAAAGREPGRALNLVVVLDNSGSMERVDRVMIVRQTLRVLSQQLTEADKVSVVAFARTPRLVVDGLAGNRTDELLGRVLNLNPQGGTNLEAAMDLAYATAEKHFSEKGNNRVILLTDGAANLGNVDPAALKRKVESFRGKGVALDCFGIGWDGYNDAMLETLSRNGDGRYGFLNRPETVNAEFADQLAGALRVAAKNVKAQIEFNPSRVISWRQIGYEKHQLKKEQFRDNKVDAAEIGAAEVGTALYSIQVDPNGTGPIGVARIRFLNPVTGRYEEKSWPLAHERNIPSLDQAAPSMRLAAGAAMFAEWLAQSPYAAGVSPDALTGMLGDATEHFAPDARPEGLANMIRQARLIGAP